MVGFVLLVLRLTGTLNAAEFKERVEEIFLPFRRAKIR